MPYTQPRFSRNSLFNRELEAGPPRMLASMAHTSLSGISYSEGALPPNTAFTSWCRLSTTLWKGS